MPGDRGGGSLGSARAMPHPSAQRLRPARCRATHHHAARQHPARPPLARPSGPRRWGVALRRHDHAGRPVAPQSCHAVRQSCPGARQNCHSVRPAHRILRGLPGVGRHESCRAHSLPQPGAPGGSHPAHQGQVAVPQRQRHRDGDHADQRRASGSPRRLQTDGPGGQAGVARRGAHRRAIRPAPPAGAALSGRRGDQAFAQSDGRPAHRSGGQMGGSWTGGVGVGSVFSR